MRAVLDALVGLVTGVFSLGEELQADRPQAQQPCAARPPAATERATSA